MEERRIAVDNGMVLADESWVYAWVGLNRQVLYIGATGLPPEVRTWLHLTSEDPQVGRVLAHHPEALIGRVDVHAWRLPAHADRHLIRDALSAELITGSDDSESMDSVSAAATEEILSRLRQ